MEFLIIQPYNLNKAPSTDTVVAADVLGAGDGEIVMVAYGRAARLAVGKEDSSIEAAVIGIIDEYDVTPGHYHGDLDPARIKHKKSVHEE